MKTIFLVITILFFNCCDSFAQQLPVGTCGIVYVHDAAGNRTRRVYFCNNGIDPYPQRTATPAANDPKEIPFTENEIKNMEIQEVEALYPNPTSGVFNVLFSKKLQQANIIIVDMNGKVMQQFRASGLQLTCDLSSYAAGTYFIRIQEKGSVISKKIIKQ